jgi:enoyl-CoA hydratase/carnithine racemase
MGLAQEWLCSGRTVTATAALEGGLVRSLYPAPDVLAEAQTLAREIADNTAPISVALTRGSCGRCRAAPTRLRRAGWSPL